MIEADVLDLEFTDTRDSLQIKLLLWNIQCRDKLSDTHPVATPSHWAHW